MDFKGIVYLYLRYLNNLFPATASPRAETARYPAKPLRKERGRSSGRGIRSGAKKIPGRGALRDFGMGDWGISER